VNEQRPALRLVVGGKGDKPPIPPCSVCGLDKASPTARLAIHPTTNRLIHAECHPGRNRSDR
jgi:hypothetical protein